jgi:hypothetical protein
MSNCLWNDLEGAHRYHLASWDLVSVRKEYGGLGLPNLRDLNICLLASWLRRYEQDRGKLWREILDFKYKTDRVNIFQSTSVGSSPFFKGFLWAAQAARMGFKWKIGNGRRVRFWEDLWLGNSSLAIQYWKLYRFVNEKNKSVASLWDGTVLKCTFSRSGDTHMLDLWEEVCQIAATIAFSEEEDSMIWQFSSNGIYNVQSLYRIINFRGIQPVLVSSIWDIKIPPRVQYFLWLLSKNRLLTRDNLGKRRKVDDPTCLFCNEHETVNHLFFECVVANQLLCGLSDIVGVHLGSSLDNIGNYWLSSKRNGILNMCSSAAFWRLWKLRNDLCFQRKSWKSMAILFYNMAMMLQNWAILCPEGQKEVLMKTVGQIKKKASQVHWICWK